MPQILTPADKIARELGQAILLVDFRTPEQRQEFMGKVTWDRVARARFTNWMKENCPDIHCQDAYPPLSPGTIICPYFGTMAVVASEHDQPDAYQKIVGYWEDAAGNPKYATVTLFLVPKDFAYV